MRPGGRDLRIQDLRSRQCPRSLIKSSQKSKVAVKSKGSVKLGQVATEEPAETLHLAQELGALDVHLAEGRLQQELMAKVSYTGKLTQFKATMEPTDQLKKDIETKPLVEALSKGFLGIKQKFQMEGTIIIRKLVGVEVDFYHSSMLPTVVKSLFRNAKQAVVSCRPQQQVLEMLNRARVGHVTLAPRLLKSDKTIAAYILKLLLASSSDPSLHNMPDLSPLEELTFSLNTL
jgi:hypothetical protein